MAEYSDDVIVIGDGPTGVSAALFLARGELKVRVLGQDQTPMHKAELHNVLGVPGMSGSQYMEIARKQAEEAGARFHHEHVTAIHHQGGFTVRTQSGATFEARYVVLASGRNTRPAEMLGLEAGETGVRVDIQGRTSVPGVYAGGNLARGITQAIVSAGDGATIALDILGKETGAPYHDYDVATRPEPRPPTS